MNFIEHKIGGITASLIMGGISLFSGVPLNLIIIMMVSCFIFSLFPDTDIKSISSKLIYLLGILFAVYLWYIGQIGLLIVMIAMLFIPQVCKHRGFTHSIVGALIFSMAWAFILKNLGLSTGTFFSVLGLDFSMVVVAAMCGFFTHFLLDFHFELL